MRASLLIALLALANPTAAQIAVLSGKVSDELGRPVPDARVSFSVLQGRRQQGEQELSEFGLAQSRHLLSLAAQDSKTDAQGAWLRNLSTSETAILTAGSHIFLMEVRARGFLPWFRAIDGDLREESTKDVTLVEGLPKPYLAVQLAGGQRPYRGFALIERAFRIPDGSSIWLPSILPLSESGQFEFYEPPRVPGELAALEPTAREESYRLSFFVAGLENRSSMVAPGSWRLELASNDLPEIELLSEGGEPAKGPIEVSYLIAGQEHRLLLPSASLPRLGDLSPSRLIYPGGELQLSGWPQTTRLRLPTQSGRGQQLEGEPRIELHITVVDRRGLPVHGAAVWLEDRGVELAPFSSKVFAASDEQGRAVLHGLPAGEFRFRVQHPSKGSRETVLQIAAARAEAIIPIRQQNLSRPPVARYRGTLLLDLGSPPSAIANLPTELGIITNDRRLIREDFATRPRWIRVDGLPPGAANLYLQSKGEKTILIAGVLSGDFDNPALRVDEIQPRRFDMTVRDVEGNPLRGVFLSLGEGEQGSTPYTSRLIRVEKGDKLGSFWFETPIRGNPLLRVHDEDGNYLDLEVPMKNQDRYVEVVLSGR